MSKITSRKVIFLLCQPLDERNFERFGLQLWRDKNWEVEIWDFTPFLFPDVWKKFNDEHKSIVDDKSYFLIENKSTLKILLKRKERGGIFIDLIKNTSYHYLLVKYIFFRRGMHCVILQLGSLPLPEITATSISQYFKKAVHQIFQKRGYFFSYLAEYSVYRFFNFLYEKYTDKTHIAISGELSYEDAKKKFKNGYNIIKAHNFDYDRFLNRNNTLPRFEPRYIVFLDEDMPYHSDFLYQKVKSPVTPEKYYPSINKGLKFISELLHCDIKIAAHPRSNYTGLRSSSFDDASVYKNITDELIKSCEGVVCHCSASIQLAILYNKPLIFVTTNELIDSPYQIYIDNFASELATKVLNLDLDYSNKDILKHFIIDESKYLSYKTKYIKLPGTAERFSWEIISDHAAEIQG
jgi:hypothetical protein